MGLTRRRLLVGAGLGLLAPRPLRAQSALEREHQPRLEVPILAEDATAVPVQVSVEHPMEPDHHIKSIEIALDTDPVPYKGKFLFTPASGRAWVAFPMRSGAGGLLRATAECTRHGRFTATRELRVADGGCTTGPDPVPRERLGRPQLRAPATIRAGETVEVRTRVEHNSHTGLVMKNGRPERDAPEFYLKQMLVYLDDQPISEFQMTSAVSANPVIRFALKGIRSGTLRVVFVNSEGRRWEVAQAVRV
jgi:predicted secreted protein